MLSLKPVTHASLALLATAAMFGCGTTHTADDAALAPDVRADVPLDAFALPDAYAVPDAVVCPDRDRDGARDAACGGDDCDDANAALGPVTPVCTTPTTSLSCASGMTQTTACRGRTPYCDARTGMCSSDACGDRVLHANEECDQFEMCPGCRRGCRSTTDCGPDWVCTPEPFSPPTGGNRIQPQCMRPNAGGASMGTRCRDDSECYSNLCDAAEGRCTESSYGYTPECSGPHRWPRYVGYTRDAVVPGGLMHPAAVCQFECAHSSDCGDGAGCLPMQLPVPSGEYYIVGVCIADRGTTSGGVAQGEACTSDHACGLGMCVFGRCSRHCRTDDDCDAGAPNCAVADRTMPPPEAASDYWAASPRPAAWGTPFPRVCLP